MPTNRMIDFLVIAIFALILCGCASTQTNHAAANYVFTNAKVYTVNSAQPWAESVAIRGNKIVHVDGAADADRYIGADAQTIDLKGEMLVPGFVSGHDHLIAYQWMSYGVDLYPATSKAEYHQSIKDYVAANPDEKIILGIGWNPDIYGGAHTAAELDALVADRPAILLEFTVHDAWLNFKALEIGGITRYTKDPCRTRPTGTGAPAARSPGWATSSPGCRSPSMSAPGGRVFAPNFLRSSVLSKNKARKSHS